MRTRLFVVAALSVLALAAIAAPVVAQAGFPSGRLRIAYYGPEELFISQGGNATFTLEFSRECTDLDVVLPERSLAVTFTADIPITVNGAPEVTFANQVCASDGNVAMNETYSLLIPVNATVGTHNVTMETTLSPAVAGGPPGEGADPLTITFEVTPAQPGPTGNTTTEPPEDPVPGFEWVVAALVCIAVTWVRRRKAL